MEQVTAVITIVSAVVGGLIVWTTTVVALTMWLSRRFRALESLIYRKINEIEKHYYRLHTRLYRIELRVFGSTFAGEPSNISDQSSDQDHSNLE